MAHNSKGALPYRAESVEGAAECFMAAKRPDPNFVLRFAGDWTRAYQTIYYFRRPAAKTSGPSVRRQGDVDQRHDQDDWDPDCEPQPYRDDQVAARP